MVVLFALEYMTALGMTMQLLFLDSRRSRGRIVLTVYGTTALVMMAVASIYLTAGPDTALRTYTLIAHVPALLLLLALSRFRGWRMVFQLFSSILFCTLVQHAAGLVYYLSGARFWALILAYAVLSAGVILFLVRFLRPLFFRTLLELRQGWWLMCLVMAIYYVIIIYLIPGYVGLTLSSTILKPAVSLLMAGFYSVLIFLFTSVSKEAEARHNAQLLAMELSALESRTEAVRTAELAIRTERHDLRHRLQAAAELVSRGDRDEALDFLNAAQERLDEHREVRWCRPPVLDAVFSSYFLQAQHQDIRIEADITLPDALPVDEGELAVVLANALENAINANLALPPEDRVIRCRVVCVPSLMLEISNPCTGRVAFDDSGLPVSARDGHGLGVQSISAFCQRHGAVCEFDLSDGWFCLRLVI